MMRRVLLSCVLAAGLLGPGAPARAAGLTVDHRAITVIDGDTIQFDGTVWQLAGIDAPELGQVCDHGGHLWRCGLAAAYELRKFIGMMSAPITCFPQPRPKAKAKVEAQESIREATCTVGDEDIAMMMIQSGHAAVVPGGPVLYAASEHHAREASLGIWGGAFIMPWEWRQGRRLPHEEPSDEAPWDWQHLSSNLTALLAQGTVKGSECLIKAVVTADHHHVYYGPLDAGYAKIKVNKHRGERYFCSDDEARRAGWRRDHEAAPAR